MTPQIGERWRWSYCDGPDWCCGNEGEIVSTEIYEGKLVFNVVTNDATRRDAFSLDDVNRAERIA